MNAQFFAAGRDDIDAILVLQQEFYSIENQKDTIKEVLRTLIDNANFGKIWLIMINGKLSGYVIITLGFSFELKGKTALLEELYLQSEYRNHGIEEKAINFLAVQCKSMGVKAIHLQVNVNNTNNFLLYQKYGFQDSLRMLMYLGL